MTKPKVLAFYLPQFHPTKENDEWWGKGFTEWTNVVKAKPRFIGHYQPHIPSDLGFYDLRVRDVKIEQVNLAKKFGIDGFCYYHYWFNGKRILNRPLDELLADKEIEFPFCLCWANESWTKNWTGQNKYVLQKQEHSNIDDVNHIRWLMKVFNDSRYIKINGKPLILIYRADLLPNPRETVQSWRNEVKKNGFQDIELVAVYNNFSTVCEEVLINEYGFDGVVEFQPNIRYIPRSAIHVRIQNRVKMLLNRVIETISSKPTKNLFSITYRHSYNKLVSKNIVKLSEKVNKNLRIYPTVIPSWDNSPRRSDGARVIQNFDSNEYQKWLEYALKYSAQYESNSYVFINAWNEWAEGCYLEPDRKLGYRFLEATLRAKESLKTS